MTHYEKYVLCYEAMDFEGCGAILYDLIHAVNPQGLSLTSDYQTTFAIYVESLHHYGAHSPTVEEFDQIWSYMYQRLIEGLGNPTLNN